VLVVFSVNTARVAATNGGSSKETPRSRAATAARTASGAGVGRADTRSVVVSSETGAIVEAMRQAGTGGVGSAVVAFATAKWVTSESNPVEKEPTSRPTHARSVRRKRERGADKLRP
jgi:hypothetical protein